MSKGERAGQGERACDLLVLGGGPGGYSAAFRAADLGLKVVIVEERSALGGVCLNVGCIPSKTYLHQAAVIREAAHVGAAGIEFPPPRIDAERLRAHKDGIVAKLVGGLAGLAKARKVEVIHGVGRFAGSNRLDVTGGASEVASVSFKSCIIAVGSAPSRLPFLPEDPRVLDSTSALELPMLGGTMLVIGGGIIGLEMATIYSALGAEVDIVELTDGLMPGTDRDLVASWQKLNAPRLGRVMLGTRIVSADATPKGLSVRFEGKDAEQAARRYDLVLGSVGRVPNGGRIDADRAGVAVDDKGFIAVDAQMRTNQPHIFAIGDVIGQPMLAHKAVHEGHIAAEVIAGEILDEPEAARAAFDARVIPSVAYTDPEIAWAGVTETVAKAKGLDIEIAKFPWAASGRALSNGCDDGFTKLIFDRPSKRIIGGAIVGPSAGDMIGEIALAIEMGAEAADLALTIHPHPTLGETIGLAGEVAMGWCTDLPPARKSPHVSHLAA